MQEMTMLRDFLDREQEVGIVIGNHQNLDTYASALSLYLSLTQAGKKVQIVSKKNPTVEVSSLVGIDRVKESFVGNTGKLVVALPYIKGEVEKVLFTEAPETINFHLTAAEGRSITPFDLKDVKLMWEGGAPAAIITLGVGTVDELAGVVDTNTAKIVNIDNFSGNTRFGEVVMVDEGFSSLSEVVGKIIKDLALPTDLDIAQNIMDGVLFSTRNFTKPNTSPLAFEAVSNSMYQGAQRKADERREQNAPMQNNNRQPQERQGRDHQDRNRDHNRQQQNNRPQRVSENDFPAMHMQNRPGQNQGQNNDNRRMNSPMRNPQNNPQRPNQQFGQNRNMADIRTKIMEEAQRSQTPFQAPAEEVKDAQIIDEQPQMSQPINDMVIPEEQSYNTQPQDEIPDDWLMPKVFKSSKNNN
jgi:hypothetical protein